MPISRSVETVEEFNYGPVAHMVAVPIYMLGAIQSIIALTFTFLFPSYQLASPIQLEEKICRSKKRSHKIRGKRRDFRRSVRARQQPLPRTHRSAPFPQSAHMNALNAPPFRSDLPISRSFHQDLAAARITGAKSKSNWNCLKSSACSSPILATSIDDSSSQPSSTPQKQNKPWVKSITRPVLIQLKSLSMADLRPAQILTPRRK